MAYVDSRMAIYRRMAKRFGTYTAARHMHKQGVPFETALKLLSVKKRRN